MAQQGAEAQLCWALSVSFVMLVTEAARILQQKAAQMISNPQNPTEEWGGQLVRNPVLLIREECSAFHLDAGSVTVLSASKDWGDELFVEVLDILVQAFKQFRKCCRIKHIHGFNGKDDLVQETSLDRRFSLPSTKTLEAYSLLIINNQIHFFSGIIHTMLTTTRWVPMLIREVRTSVSFFPF